MASVASRPDMFWQLDAEQKSRVGEARFDVLVTNAGIAIAKSMERYTEHINERFALDVKGGFFHIAVRDPSTPE